MDNMAHAMAAVAVTASTAPQFLKSNFKKAVIVSMIVANIPDIDVLLHLLGQVIYHFHHRGFTHSFLGLPIMTPLGMGVVKILWKEKVFRSLAGKES